MALSDLAVRKAKATSKAYTLADLDGLSLAVAPGGGKSWHFRYQWYGKQKRMSLGTYPELSCETPVPCGTKPAPCWPRTPIPTPIASRSGSPPA